MSAGLSVVMLSAENNEKIHINLESYSKFCC